MNKQEYEYRKSISIDRNYLITSLVDKVSSYLLVGGSGYFSVWFLCKSFEQIGGVVSNIGDIKTTILKIIYATAYAVLGLNLGAASIAGFVSATKDLGNDIKAYKNVYADLADKKAKVKQLKLEQNNIQ